MKIYQSIPSINQVKEKQLNNIGYSFYKYDGSNLRFEWDKKKGWHKFGTRHHLFDKDTELYNQSLPILYSIGDSIISNLQKQFKFDNMTCYLEFLGDSSFAGSHVLEEQKTLKLFDVSIYRYGLIEPDKFVDIFGNEDYSAKLLYHGKLTNEYIESVKTNANLIEGIIFKSGVKNNIFMTKVKTNHYLDKLKQKYGNVWESFV
jgi:predicted AlkP superfamily phosphohydrolase/phosphomutase